MLARVAAKEEFVEFAADGIDHDVLGRFDLVHRLRARGEKLGRLFFGLQVGVEQHVESRAVDRDRHQLIAHQGAHAVLVRPPLGELRQIFDDLLAVGVEDVRAVLVIHYAVGIRLVVGIAADVIAPVDQQHARVVLACQPLGEHRTGKTSADDQIIVARRRAQKRAGHSAATSSAEEAVALLVPRRSATRPAIRACVVSQLVADRARSASASQPLSGVPDSSSALSHAATKLSASSAINTPSNWP